MSELTHEELTRLLDYDPETGVFRWKVARGRAVKAGDLAGSKGSKGSKGNKIIINGKNYFSRRLAWLFTNGEYPRNNLFVKNGDQLDDSIKNIGMLPDKPKELTQEYLKKCIDYNPKTGEFKWKITQGTNVYNNSAFHIQRHRNNYISLVTRILGKPYATPRLIVFWMTGYMPSEKRLVITIDNNSINLKWDNIKVGGRSEAKQKARSHGSCATKGVYYNKSNGKYQANIRINGKPKYLGTFPTEAKAHAAYMKAARKHYGDLANDGYQHAMYEMEYEEVERPVEPVPEPEPVIDREIDPVIQHSDDF